MAGRRYSAGRIFLDVIPSFKGVIRETAREAQKVRAEVEKDNAEAAAKEEQAQGKIRKRERVKAEREIGDAVAAERRAAEARMSRKERLAQAARIRAQQRAEQLAARNSVAGLVKQLDEADRKLADAYRRRERERVKAEERAAKMVQDVHIKQGREMWAEVQADAKRAAKERERMAKEAADAEVAAQKRAVERAKRDLRAAQGDYTEIRNKRLAADRAAAKKWDSEYKALLDAQTKEVQRAAKMQGGRFGQELRKGVGHALADLDEVKITADTEPIMREVAAVRAALENLRSKRIGVDIDGKGALKELVALERAARRLDRRGVDIHVRTNAKGVSAILREMIDSMRAAGRASADLGNRHAGGRDRALDAANAFRLFNVRILAIALAVPMVVPMIGSLAGAIGMLIPMALGAAGGLGVLIAGLTGIAPAVSALGDVQQNAAKDALAYEKSMRNASRAVRDAQQGVAQAEQQASRAAEDSARRVEDAREGVVDATNRAAEQVQSALRRQREAEKDLTRAQKDSADAQRDLTQARQDAQDRLRDMALRAAGGALAERQAKLDLARAKAMYLSTRDDGSATREEKEQALLNYERAELDVAEIIQSNKELAEERAHADKVGVEGMEEVVRAKERVVDTTEREREAEERLADAQKDVTRARVEGAESIADAQRDLADAIRDQQRQQEDSARSIRDAQERLTDAQMAYQEALTQTGEIGSASMQKLRDAMADLGPEGRAFAYFLHGLREPLLQLRRDIQAGLLPGVQEFMEDMIRVYGPGFSRWATEMGVVLGDIFRQMSEVFQNPLMTAFFDSMEKYGSVFTQQVATIMLNLVQVIAGLSTAFAPFAEGFGDALVRITAGWAAWAGGLSESDGFHRFMAYVERVGPVVVDLFVALGEALINLGIGLAPYGEMLITWATEFFTWIAKADPKMIGAIAAGIIGIVVAIQLASLAMATLSGWSMFFGKNKAGGFHNPFALVVLGVIGLITSIAILRDRYEWFDEMMAELTEKSKELAAWLWENRDAVMAVAGALALMFGVWKFSGPLMTGLELMSKVGSRLWGVFGKIGSIMLWLVRTPIALLKQAYTALAWFAIKFAMNPLSAIWGVITKVGKVALWLVKSPLKLLGAAFAFLTSPISLTVGGIALLITFLIWAWREHEGFRNAILDVWARIKEGVAAFVGWFSTDGVGGISAAWDWLVNAMLWAWENIAKPVWNEMVVVFQWVADMLVDNIFPFIGDGLKILWGVIELVWLWIRRKLGEGSGWWSEHKDQVLDVLAVIGAFFADFYENGIKPTFEMIGNIIKWVFDNIINPTFENIAKGVTTMVDAFRTGESLIASIWAGIVAAVAEPVNVVINWVNEHMIGTLNEMLGDIGIEWQIPVVPTVSVPTYTPRDRGLRAGSQRYGAGTGTTRGRYATGGVLPGYSPGVDNIRFTSPFGDLLLGGGEAILRPEVTAVLGKGWVDMVNAAAINGGQDGVRRRVLGQYASGGQIDFEGLPRIPRTDIAQPPKEGLGKRLWEIFTTAAKALKNPKKAIRSVIDRLTEWLPLRGTFPGEWLLGGMRKLGGAIADKVKELIGTFTAPTGNNAVNYGGFLGWAPGVPPMSWPTTWEMIREVAPESMITSTFRPGAITASGYPSLHGLGRAVDIVSPNMAETFMKIRNLRKWSQLFYSPMGNLQIGYRDAIVHATHFDHIHAAYDKGGVFDRADFDGNVGLYDAGGVLDDRDLALNLSGKPEAVLTNDQWRALQAAAEALHRRDSGGGAVYAPQLTTIQGATASEISDELMWDLRSFERRGGARGGD